MSPFELAVTLVTTNQVLTSQFLTSLVLVTLDQLLSLRHSKLRGIIRRVFQISNFCYFPPHGGLQSFKKSGNLFISLTLKYDFRYLHK